MVKILASALALSVLSLSAAQAEPLRGWVKTLSAPAQDAQEESGEAFLYPNTPQARRLSSVADGKAAHQAADIDTDAAPRAASFSIADIIIDFPENYETSFEGDVREALNGWLDEHHGPAGADQAAATRAMTLSFDVSVAADYRQPKWRSPVFIAYADTARFNGPHYPQHYRRNFAGAALGLDPGVNAITGAPRLTIRMFLEEEGARVWTGYAGAPVYGGASRSQIARALALALAERMGRTTNEEKFEFEPSGAPLIEIVAPPVDAPVDASVDAPVDALVQ